MIASGSKIISFYLIIIAHFKPFIQLLAQNTTTLRIKRIIIVLCFAIQVK